MSASARRTPTRTASVALAMVALVMAGLFGFSASPARAAADRTATTVTAGFAGVVGGHVTGTRGHATAARGGPVQATPSDGQGDPLGWAVLPGAALLFPLLAYVLRPRGAFLRFPGSTGRLRHQRAPPRSGAPRAA